MSLDRRQYLTRTGAGVGALAALAGCLDDVTGDDGDGDVDDRTGERALDRAVGTLNDAAMALEVEDGQTEDPEAVEFDPAAPRESIADARSHLETAAEEFGTDRQSDVETLRTYADVLEALVDVTASVTDDQFADADADVSSAIDEEGDPEAADEIVDDLVAELETARSRYDDAVADFEDLDAEQFEALARIDYDDLEEGIDRLGVTLDGLSTLIDGYDAILDGYVDLEEGEDYYDDGDYDEAETSFEAAETAFDRATTTLEGTSPPDDLASYFETATCQSTHLSDAADAFADAVAAADSGDPFTADERRNEGEEAVDRARDCS